MIESSLKLYCKNESSEVDNDCGSDSGFSKGEMEHALSKETHQVTPALPSDSVQLKHWRRFEDQVTRS
ncbi:Hypothetical predicted protein [Octopus vulgaris]|uniref:Uncharacterized protein n=1 Tax=Octopus vulgaris TaxID=6645 RepID=A0AA36ASV9_OCTVU|nr:Hypothetical predicted protein [Octopus vulgaris]